MKMYILFIPYRVDSIVLLMKGSVVFMYLYTAEESHDRVYKKYHVYV